MGSPLCSASSCRSDVATIALLVISICIETATETKSEDWPQWRGSNRNAVSTETGFLSSWIEAQPALAWKASGIGDGYSSVVIANGQIFTTGQIDGIVQCFALDLQSGEQQWTKEVSDTSRNVMATPTVHDGLVYVLDPDGELVCLDAMNGTEVWRRNFIQDFGGRLMSGRGYGESPLIEGDKLICTPGGEDAMLVALNRRTGSLIWKSHMPNIGEKGRDGAAFSSVVLSDGGGFRQYIQLTGRGLAGFEAKTGKYLWGYNDISNQTANIPTPIVRGDLVFSANGYHSGAVLLRLEEKKDGNGIEAHEVYRLRGNKFQNHHGGFVLIDDHIYGGHGSNNGLPTCIELQTGKIEWKRRGPGTGSASVVAADGRLYFHYQDGVIALIDASKEGYNLLGQFNIPAGGDSWSHPVVAHGKLFIREKNDLWVYDLKEKGSAVDFPNPEAHQITLNRENERELYRFVFESNISGSGIPTVTISDAQLDPDGSISDVLHRRLLQRSSAFILSVAGTQISDDGMEQIGALDSLVGLNMELCGDVTDIGFAALGRSKQLAALVAPGTSISKAGLDQLAAAPKLAAITLEVCNNVTDVCCESIGRMEGLRALVLKKTGFEPERISDTGLQELSQLKNLELLNLYGNAVTDDGLRQLSLMSNLRELDLSLLPITDNGLRHLSKLPQLCRLELLYSEGFAGTNITDAGLKSLGNFSQLTHLNLIGARISDAGLKHIHHLDQLIHLKLTNSTATLAGLQELKEALPDCEVIAR